jgi:hypothetical protein
MSPTALALPVRKRGRPTQAEDDRYFAALRAWAEAVQEIRSRLDFQVSARGWCYVLEAHGLAKGDFDRAEALINVCRKIGLLPLHICATDDSREFENADDWTDTDPIEDEARSIVSKLRYAHESYTPFSFWERQPYYLQLLVEKIDLRTLFSRIARRYHIPLANAKGWTDFNQCAEMMRRFKAAEGRGQQPVLLYCGDHDVHGLLISDFLLLNMVELSAAVGWSPENLIIDRFGLNYDFIEAHGLTWIDGLGTGSGKDLSDSTHKDHFASHVQEYLQKFGPRKCEANALVVAPEAGRQLLLDTIHKYIDPEAPARYLRQLKEPQEALRREIVRQMSDWTPEPEDEKPEDE